MSYRVDIKDQKGLSESQLEIVRRILEESCIGEICIRRSVIYEAAKKHIALDIEQYRFEQFLTKAIKQGLLIGFETRSGRSGGICRTGTFSKRDEIRKSKRPDPVKKACYITVEKITYKVPMTEADARNFVLNILQAKPSGTTIPDLFVNNEPFWLLPGLTATHIMKNYVSSSNGVEIEKPTK